MATLAQHIAARDDDDLTARMVAAAEQARIPTSSQWVQAHRGLIVSVPVDGTTLADVHAYAVATTPAPPLAPGANPALVTDSQITAAVAAAYEADHSDGEGL